jgi:hypothetical protein
VAGFFEAPPPPPEPPEDLYRQPVWAGPPDNVIGAAAPLRVVLARTDEVAVAITGATAYPTGATLALAVRLRTPREHPDFFHAFLHRARGADPADLFKFGVQFSDGRKATTLHEHAAFAESEPAQPVLSPRGGGGGGRAWSWDLWLWPLPPPGPLVLVCKWPAQGIAETRVDLDAAPILEAAARAEELWPDGGASPPGPTASTVRLYP